jgi:beta-glucosidase
MACAKHLTVYNQEHDRMFYDVEVDDRTLREVYLAPFERAVEVRFFLPTLVATLMHEAKANVSSIMCAYNQLNGSPACRDPALNGPNGWLKREVGFKGFVVWPVTRSRRGGPDKSS